MQAYLIAIYSGELPFRQDYQELLRILTRPSILYVVTKLKRIARDYDRCENYKLQDWDYSFLKGLILLARMDGKKVLFVA